METTFNLDDQLLRQTKEFAARTGTTVSAVVEDALREMLARQKETTQTRARNLSIISGQGLQPGVDLDDSAMLLDRMDGT